jgi:hypothetical protein
MSVVFGLLFVAKTNWLMVVPLQARAEFFGGDLSHWFQFNLKGGIV